MPDQSTVELLKYIYFCSHSKLICNSPTQVSKNGNVERQEQHFTMVRASYNRDVSALNTALPPRGSDFLLINSSLDLYLVRFSDACACVCMRARAVRLGIPVIKHVSL